MHGQDLVNFVFSKIFFGIFSTGKHFFIFTFSVARLCLIAS